MKLAFCISVVWSSGSSIYNVLLFTDIFTVLQLNRSFNSSGSSFRVYATFLLRHLGENWLRVPEMSRYCSYEIHVIASP